MKNILKVLVVLVLLTALAGAAVLVKNNQETRRGAAYANIESLFLPDTKSVKVGEVLTSTLVLDCKDKKLSGVDLRVKFDKSKLKVKQIKPVLVGDPGVNMGRALFKAETDVLDKAVNETMGTINLSGISMEEVEANMATGVVNLIKVDFEAIAAGSAEVTLDSSYDNAATGYNPLATDQSLAIAIVKKAIYTVTVSGNITPTATPGVTNTPTIPVGTSPTPTSTTTRCTSDSQCGWCGSTCSISNIIRPTACLDVMPPAGYGCKCVNGSCLKTANVPIVTPGTATCNQRCFNDGQCGGGLICQPIWWPGECPPIPAPILSRANTGQTISKVEIDSLRKICPTAENILGPSSNVQAVDGTGSGGEVKLPTMVGTCRNKKCLSDRTCACANVPTVTIRPQPTGTTSCSCPAGVPVKKQGNANCDAKIDMSDFEVWRSEAFDRGGITGAEAVTMVWKADFNCDRKANLSDFEIWRHTYFDSPSVETN